MSKLVCIPNGSSLKEGKVTLSDDQGNCEQGFQAIKIKDCDHACYDKFDRKISNNECSNGSTYRCVKKCQNDKKRVCTDTHNNDKIVSPHLCKPYSNSQRYKRTCKNKLNLDDWKQNNTLRHKYCKIEVTGRGTIFVQGKCPKTKDQNLLYTDDYYLSDREVVHQSKLNQGEIQCGQHEMPVCFEPQSGRLLDSQNGLCKFDQIKFCFTK